MCFSYNYSALAGQNNPILGLCVHFTPQSYKKKCIYANLHALFCKIRAYFIKNLHKRKKNAIFAAVFMSNTMRQRKLFILLLLLMACSASYGQSAKQADDLFNAHAYAEARTIYESLLRKQPTNQLYLYRAARCAQESGDLAAAETLFIKAGTKYPLRNFCLGEIYYAQWRMAEAIAAYEAFLPSIDESHERYPIVQQRIASAQVIARYLKHVSRVEVLNVQRVPQSDLLSVYRISEQSGVLALDSLGSSFTTQRGDRRYYSVRVNEAQDSLSRERIMLVSCQRLLEHWESPDTLRATVNNGNRNCYPFVLTDGATLYFASDREGGLGGLDIYMTRYNAALGEWLPAENIGLPYNSPADDYLFVADEPNNYAYFATNRHCPDTDSAEVYQIVLGERNFLRGLPADELVALARLDSLITSAPIEQTTAVAQVIAPATNSHHNTADSIFFVLNDHEAYTHLSDFRNDSARVLYEQYIELEHIQQQAQTMLDSLRHQYYAADSNTRASLDARIPILSGEINQRKQLLRQTLSRVRTLELQQ